ncbi:hypothetical protein ANANG_G00071040 [Anguilla anguilla]|uniref:Secreted protein n=1 Tax=Anguilla anguilla TaxID=7936 RepID=A0A9D3MQL3_ANGAN|nr:hypothetical protein ANANG_G00071040 [Anguilla anguilla]
MFFLFFNFFFILSVSLNKKKGTALPRCLCFKETVAKSEDTRAEFKYCLAAHLAGPFLFFLCQTDCRCLFQSSVSEGVFLSEGAADNRGRIRCSESSQDFACSVYCLILIQHYRG